MYVCAQFGLEAGGIIRGHGLLGQRWRALRSGLMHKVCRGERGAAEISISDIQVTFC